MKNNAIAAGAIALTNSVFPFLVLINVLHWTPDTIAGAMLVVTNAVTLGGLLFAQKNATSA